MNNEEGNNQNPIQGNAEGAGDPIGDQANSSQPLPQDALGTTRGADGNFKVLHTTVNINDALAQVPKEDGKVNTIHTFQGDIANAVKTDNVSMIKIALAEKERREQEGSYAEMDVKKKAKPVYILTFIILIAMAGAVGFVYWYFNRPPAPTLEELIAPQEPEIIYSESQVAVSVDNKRSDIFLDDLREEVQKKLDLGTVKRILITAGTGTSTKNISSTEFFDVIRSRAPGNLIRSIDPFFVIGAYSFAPHDVFIIFKINSYDNAYPGMLAWEPSMELDLGNLFTENVPVMTAPIMPVIPATSTTPATATTSPNSNASSTGSSTTLTTLGTTTQPLSASTTPAQSVPTTPTTTAQAPVTTPVVRTTSDADKAQFVDKILQNKDTRALVGSDGKIRFLYSFLDRETLVIVSSEKGFKEIITRMTTGRVRR